MDLYSIRADGDRSGLYALYEVCVQYTVTSLKTFKVLRYKGKAKDSIILLVMQSLKHSFILNGVESGIDCSKIVSLLCKRRGHATHRFIPCG